MPRLLTRLLQVCTFLCALPTMIVIGTILLVEEPPPPRDSPPPRVARNSVARNPVARKLATPPVPPPERSTHRVEMTPVGLQISGWLAGLSLDLEIAEGWARGWYGMKPVRWPLRGSRIEARVPGSGRVDLTIRQLGVDVGLEGVDADLAYRGRAFRVIREEVEVPAAFGRARLGQNSGALEQATARANGSLATARSRGAGRCLMATLMAFDHVLELDRVRRFRERSLRRSRIGRRLVSAYYTLSPYAISFLKSLVGGEE